jgi:hypothetical protein
MTPDRLRECLGALNWSTAALAALQAALGRRASDGAASVGRQTVEVL